MDVQTTMCIIGYVVSIVLAFVCGKLNKEVHYNRNTAADLRERISDSIPNSGELERSKHMFEDTVKQVRENQRIDE